MPTYEYKCPNCGNDFEVFQSMHDAPVTKCEKCGGTVQKVFGGAGIIFKGSGFYVNDYKNKETAPAPACEGCAGCSSNASEG